MMAFNYQIPITYQIQIYIEKEPSWITSKIVLSADFPRCICISAQVWYWNLYHVRCITSVWMWYAPFHGIKLWTIYIIVQFSHNFVKLKYCRITLLEIESIEYTQTHSSTIPLLKNDKVGGMWLYAKKYLHSSRFAMFGCGPVSIDFKLNIKVYGANMGPIWGRQDPGGPHVGLMKLAIWDP